MADPALRSATPPIVRNGVRQWPSAAAQNGGPMGRTALLQARYDGPIPAKSWHAAEAADRAHLAARPARQRRLARLYDRADRRAVGSTDPRVLATATLAHWLYVRATGGPPYSWPRMASDYRHGLLDRAGLTASAIAALPAASRPQIARRALIAAYGAYRAERERRRVDLLRFGALGLAAE